MAGQSWGEENSCHHVPLHVPPMASPPRLVSPLTTGSLVSDPDEGGSGGQSLSKTCLCNI